MLHEGFALIESLVQDLRFALRTLRRSPGFTLVSVLTLALGIGSNVAMWSVADAVLFRDLPYEDPDSLMVVWQSSPEFEFRSLPLLTFRDLEERSRAFEAMSIALPQEQNLHGPEGPPERIRGSLVSEDFLDVLGMTPILGRDFLPDDDRPGAERAALLSYEIWQRRFAGRADILEQDIQLDDQIYRVIGVLPKGLGEEILGSTTLGDVWMPIGLFRDSLPFNDRAERLHSISLGRVSENMEALVADDLRRILEELKLEDSLIQEDAEIHAGTVRQQLLKDDRHYVYLLLAAVTLVLAIAVANLINLQLTRLAKRERELATRWALGAKKYRLVCQLVVESLVLSLLGGGLGMLLVNWMGRSFPWLLGEAWAVGEIHAGVLIGVLFLTLLVGVVIGVVPASQVIRFSRKSRFAKMQIRSLLPNKKLRQILVSIEVALALVTLVGAGLLYGSLSRLEKEDPGFAVDDRLTLKVLLPQATYDDEPRWVGFFEEALQRLGALRGVKTVALSSQRPLGGSALGGSRVTAGDRALPPVSEMSFCPFQMVSPSYFRTLDIPLIEGRELGHRDDDRRDAERVVVISQDLADTYWPNSSAVGKQLAFEFEGSPEKPEPQWRRVVGVVADARMESLGIPPRCSVYSAFTQIPLWKVGGASPTMTFLLHVEPGKVAELVPEVRAIFSDISPELPLFGVEEMSEVLDGQLDRPRRVAVLLSVFAALSLLLVVVGVFGVVSYVVTARVREVGTRMAFGAGPKSIVKLFMWQNFVVVLAGVIIGLIVAMASARLISSALYGVPAVDPLTYALAAIVLLAFGSIAALVPIWRASKLCPLEALRYE